MLSCWSANDDSHGDDDDGDYVSSNSSSRVGGRIEFFLSKRSYTKWTLKRFFRKTIKKFFSVATLKFLTAWNFYVRFNNNRFQWFAIADLLNIQFIFTRALFVWWIFSRFSWTLKLNLNGVMNSRQEIAHI